MLQRKEDELDSLQSLVSNSDNVSVLTNLQETVRSLTCDLEAVRLDVQQKGFMLEQVGNFSWNQDSYYDNK